MARALALNGASKVYILGRRQSNLESVAKSVTTNNIIPIVCDVTSKEALQSAVAQITSETGYINLLLANSGTIGPQAEPKLPAYPDLASFVSAHQAIDPTSYTGTFDLNTTAAFFTIISFLPLLDEGNKKENVYQKSQVIVTSSIGGFNRNIPGGFAYGQSKAAATHMVKQLATQLAPYGIRTNALAPGCKSILNLYFRYYIFRESPFINPLCPICILHCISLSCYFLDFI